MATIATPLGYWKTYDSFVIRIHVTTYAERLTKIGQLLRYWVGYADFCRLDQRSTVFTLAISGITEPILTKLVHYVATIFSLNIILLNRNSHIANRFETPASGIKVILRILHQIGCHGNSPWGNEKWLHLKHNQSLITSVPNSPAPYR